MRCFLFRASSLLYSIIPFATHFVDFGFLERAIMAIRAAPAFAGFVSLGIKMFGNSELNSAFPATHKMHVCHYITPSQSSKNTRPACADSSGMNEQCINWS